MNNWTMLLLAVFFNVFAQILMKQNGMATLQASTLQTIFSLKAIMAIFAYAASFLLALFVYKHNELSVAGPTMASLTFIFIFFFSWCLFNESITFTKVFGLSLLVSGLYFINR